jgi:RNA polymerase sigma-70 factor (ECF subfamily)
MNATSNSYPDRLAGLRDATSNTLLQRVKEGEVESWSRFVRLYTPLILSWCRYYGLDHHRAEDTSQEVLIKVSRLIQDFEKYNKRAGEFRCWLKLITYNCIRGEPKAPHFQPIEGDMVGKDPADPGQDSGEEVGPSEDAILVQAAIPLIKAKCKAHTWEAMWQVVVDGRSAQDVARDLGMTVGAVWTAKSNLLRRFRELLA